jgi:hypothetical protein
MSSTVRPGSREESKKKKKSPWVTIPHNQVDFSYSQMVMTGFGFQVDL